MLLLERCCCKTAKGYIGGGGGRKKALSRKGRGAYRKAAFLIKESKERTVRPPRKGGVEERVLTLP